MTQRVNVQLWPEPLSPTSTWNKHVLSGWGEARLGLAVAGIPQFSAGQPIEVCDVRSRPHPGRLRAFANSRGNWGEDGINASLLAVLNDAERKLVNETEQARLAELDEDAAIELETRIRRARNKYVGQYRRGARTAVREHGGRGRARPQNKRAALKAEAFEETLSRVSRRVATLARQAASGTARGPDRRGPGGEAGPRARHARSRASGTTGWADRDRPAHPGIVACVHRRPRSGESTLAMGARRQAKRDSR